MSLSNEIDRLTNAKTAIASAISDKGVDVPENTKLDGFAALISAITSGGSSNTSTPALTVDTSIDYHDTSTDIANYYITSSGKETAYNNWTVTDFIEVEVGKYYALKCSSIDGRYCCYYDSTKTFVSTCNGNFGHMSLSAANSYVIFKAVSPYIRFSASTSNITSLKMYACVEDSIGLSMSFPSGYEMEMGFYIPSEDTSSVVTIDLQKTFRWADTGKESACYLLLVGVDIRKGTQAAALGAHVKFGVGERNHQMVTTSSGCSTSTTVFINPVDTTTFNQIKINGTGSYPLKKDHSYLWMVIGETV